MRAAIQRDLPAPSSCRRGIGSALRDQKGNASIGATLSCVIIDTRALAPGGSLRRYIEWDLNAANNGSPGFNLRHADGTWTSSRGTQTPPFITRRAPG